jgi:alpha-glucuronidase
MSATLPASRSVALLLLLSVPAIATAETGRAAWLRYQPVDATARSQYAPVRGPVTMLHESPVLRAAASELARGLNSMLGPGASGPAVRGGPGIVLGLLAEVRRSVKGTTLPGSLGADGFWINITPARTIIAGESDRGVLYGAFALLERVARQQPLPRGPWEEAPAAPVRWVNEWNNLDGTIERGYAGRSIFFDGGHVVDDLTRAGEYARLLGSIGINGCTINNVNANAQVLTPAFIPQLVRVAEAFRPWGVALSVSIDFSSPMKIGGLDTFDPLDPRVAAFWKQRVDAIYAAIPDFGGFVLKADSEGRLGPSAYGRTHADAANVIAEALAPHHGLLFYRGFVYNNHMDYRDLKNDRARAAVDNFKPLDGKFLPNVILQIKHGPIDFQVREPASPLFAALHDTNEAIELQITQEYLGQQRHVVYTPPMWKEVLDFDMDVTVPADTRMRAAGVTEVHVPSRVRDLVAGKTFKRPLGGFVGVSNVGRDENWLGNDLAMANLYGFGRLAWNPEASPRDIAAEWTGLTFGGDPKVVSTITDLLMDSWPAYERYTGNLGIGTLTDILGVHYGPGIESSERNGWGQWHRSDGLGTGMDRTVATGTGFTAQYPPAVAAQFESLATTPEELLLFFHHVPYTYRLKSGKTVIQHIYDEHYLGAEQAAGFVTRWKSLDGAIDQERFAAVLKHLEYQAGHAIVWRDAIVSWFRWISATPDEQGRAGHFPGRIEAETMTLDGFASQAITPWETASGALAAACGRGRTCAASHKYQGAAGSFDLAVAYFDESDGVSRFRLVVNGKATDTWTADGDVPSPIPNGHTATRHTTRGVTLQPGETIRIEVDADAAETGAVDYLEITPAR